ncbi:MAG: tetratricopeptide repeat protein [Bacteroidales bacterium]|nr:tetratricopeptide repeat protein [Bacteroidales bacterium]
MRKIIIATLLLLSFLNVYPNQKHETETIENQNQYEKLVDLAKTYFYKNTEYAFNCAYKAHAIAEENQDNARQSECNIIMGNIFKECSSYPTAISYYEKAIENLIALKENHTICKLYIRIAELYQNSEFDSKWSIEAMNNAINYAKKTDNPNTIDDTYLALGNIYAALNMHESATKYYDEILKKVINKNTIRNISTTLTRKASLMIKQENYTDALQLIDSSLYLCIRDFNDSLQVVNYYYKGKIHELTNDIESAKKYYTQAAKLAYDNNDFDTSSKIMFCIGNINKKTEDYSNAIKVFRIICDSTEKYRMYNVCYQAFYQLSQCYSLLGEYEEAYYLFNKYDIYYDSLYRIYQDKKVEELRNSYLLSANVNELKTKEIEEKNIKDNINDWKLFISIIIVLAMISITFIILYSTNKATSHKNEVTNYEQQHKIDKIENDLMEYQLKNNRELTMKLAFQLKSYLQIINPIKEDLKNAIELPENEQKNKIKNIYQHLQNNTHIFNNAENLNKQIDKVYKDFLNKLEEKHPGLTKAEKKLCTLLYINMSSKEIATITNTTIRTIETSRYRLRKKFNLSRDEDIVSFLQKI